MKKLTFVTGNKQKLLEVMEIVKRLSVESKTPFPYELVSKKVDLPELQGEPEDIAAEKARLAVRTNIYILKLHTHIKTTLKSSGQRGRYGCPRRGYLVTFQRLEWITRTLHQMVFG